MLSQIFSVALVMIIAFTVAIVTFRVKRDRKVKENEVWARIGASFKDSADKVFKR